MSRAIAIATDVRNNNCAGVQIIGTALPLPSEISAQGVNFHCACVPLPYPWASIAYDLRSGFAQKKAPRQEELRAAGGGSRPKGNEEKIPPQGSRRILAGRKSRAARWTGCLIRRCKRFAVFRERAARAPGNRRIHISYGKWGLATPRWRSGPRVASRGLTRQESTSPSNRCKGIAVRSVSASTSRNGRNTVRFAHALSAGRTNSAQTRATEEKRLPSQLPFTGKR